MYGIFTIPYLHLVDFKYFNDGIYAGKYSIHGSNWDMLGYLHPMNLQDFAAFAPKTRNGTATKKPHTRQLQICLTMSRWWFQPI